MYDQPPTPPRKWISFAGALTGRLDRLGITGGHCSIRPIQHDRVHHPGLPADRPGRTARRQPSSETSRRRPVARSDFSDSKNIPFVVTTVATLRRSSGRYLPRDIAEQQQVGQTLGGHLLLEPIGHDRLFRGGQLVDILAKDDLFLTLGVEQVDGGLRLAREQAVQDAAVAWSRRCTGGSSPRPIGSGRGCGRAARSSGAPPCR